MCCVGFSPQTILFSRTCLINFFEAGCVFMHRLPDVRMSPEMRCLTCLVQNAAARRNLIATTPVAVENLQPVPQTLA